ncbi:MAG TPA: ABC transporter permease [Gemmatimonadaceae bacterium]|jgi:predicted permease|nr:ABC transporter permease [Gemmatimonadaceae bacterium]
MRRIPRFLRLPRSAARIRADVEDEIGFDIEMRAQDLMRRGAAAADARERAAAEFGDVGATRRYLENIDRGIERDVRRSNFLEDLWSDVVIAVRTIRRTPVFASVVLLTLALGVGANTAIFSVVRRVLITPLPFRDPDQLVRLYTKPAAVDGDHDKLSAVELREVAAESRSISGITLFGNYRGTTYLDDRGADSWQLVSVAPNFFDVLGTRPIIGRVFGSDDFVRGAPSVVMISYQVWQRLFAGDRSIAGHVIQLSGRPVTVIGVLPERFVGPTFAADGLTPLNVDGVLQNAPFARSRVWRSVARLRPGVPLERWLTELATIQARIAAAHPEIGNAGIILPTPLHEAIVGGAGPVLRLVMAAALVVLLAACANIAGLFLARAVARRRELGVRAALGAGRGRLVRQVITESILYGIAGGTAGALLAVLLKVQLVHAAGSMLPQLGDVRIDTPVLAFGFAIALASGIAFGVWPAIAATRVDVREALGDSTSRGASRGASAARASRLLVGAQLAFGVVLVVGTGLMLRTVVTLTHSDLGYEASNHQATFFLSLGKFPDASSSGAFVRTFIDRAHTLPGVTAVGYTVSGPWNGSWRNVRFHVDGRDAERSSGEEPTVILATASAEYFPAVGTPVRMGRGFAAADLPGTPRVVVVSESMARRYWPNASPIGARLRLAFASVDPSDTLRLYEVVGVVKDVREDATADAMPTLYVSAEQAQIYGSAFVVRTRDDARAVLPMIRDMAHSLDPRVPLVLARTLGDVRSDLVRRQDLAMKLLGLFATLALVLAGLGVYGIVAYGVVSRSKELGIRAALGASRAGLVRAVLREGIGTAFLGITTGVAIAAALSRLVSSLLFGVSAHDTATFVAAPAILAAVALGACVVPARAASRIDPIEALRQE